MGNDLARSLNAPFLFGGSDMDTCSLGSYYYKTLGDAKSEIDLICCKCGCSGDKYKLYACNILESTPNEAALIFHFAADDISTTYQQKIGASYDKDGPKASAEISKSVTIKKGSPLVKMIFARKNIDYSKINSWKDLYDVFCIDCILKDESQKSRIKSILLHVNGNGFVINSDFKIVKPSYGDSK